MRIIDADVLEKTITEAFHGRTATGFIRFMNDKTPIEVYNKVRDLIDNAQTVEYPEQITIKCDTEEDKQKLLAVLRNARLKVLVEEERPQGEWIITGEEQGALGITYKIRKCNKCGWEHSLVIPSNYCPNCGAYMLEGAYSDEM